MDADFVGGWNQEEGKGPISVLSRTGYVIAYANCKMFLGDPDTNRNSAQYYRGGIYC